jgi:transketolase
MRRAFSDTLIKIAENDESLVFLTADLGFQVFDEFKRRFGKRYLNVGVAEAQLILAAAGLAFEGLRPVAYSIAPFVTARPYEQIRFSIAYHRLPVIIVGAGGGYTYAKAGVSHHAGDDLALMGALPGMTVVAPGGPDELSALLPQMFVLDGPSYVRVGKFGEDDVGGSEPIILGRARILKEGEKIVILSVGDVISEIQKAVLNLQKEDVHPSIYHFHTVKPLDIDALDRIGKKYQKIIVVEESIPQGGLFHEICVWKSCLDKAPKILRVGAPDEFILGNPNREELRMRIGVDADSIESFCRKEWRS